jgi:hypothetical protein
LIDYFKYLLFVGVVAIFYYCAPEVEFLPAARAVTRLVFSNTPSADVALRFNLNLMCLSF